MYGPKNATDFLRVFESNTAPWEIIKELNHHSYHLKFQGPILNTMATSFF